MKKNLTLEYWVDNSWYVGKLKEVPGVFSQGETLKELEENIQEAYALVMSESFFPAPSPVHSKEIAVQVWTGEN